MAAFSASQTMLVQKSSAGSPAIRTRATLRASTSAKQASFQQLATSSFGKTRTPKHNVNCERKAMRISCMNKEVYENTNAYGVPIGGWPTRDCPPFPRPDTDAPPTYHGEPETDQPGTRVQVRVYMIDRFGMTRFAQAALQKPVNATWHVSVVAYNREYNFSDKVAYMELGDTSIETETMHGFAPTHIYEVGNTLKSRDEVDKFVFSQLSKQYKVDTYCSFTNNCHNFAADLTEFLTGRTPEEGGFPRWCLQHGGEALSELPEIDEKRTRKVSNQIAKVMLICFGKFNRDRVKKLTGKNWIVMDDEEVAALSA